LGLLGIFIVTFQAFAGGSVETIAAARDALKERDADRAYSLLAQARQSLPNEDRIVDAAHVGQLFYMEGLAPRVFGAERERDLQKFRDALSVYPILQWDRELIDEKPIRAYFEALRAEVQQRVHQHTQVPEKRGSLKTFVDGVEHKPMEAVRSGPHLIQVQCPNGQVAGRWFDFDQDLDWTKMCAEPLDLTVSSENERDPMADFDASPLKGPDPFKWTPPEPKQRGKIRVQVSQKSLFIGAGVAGIVAVGTYAAALASRGKYDDLDDSDLRTEGQLDALRGKTNTLVGVSISSAAVGGGLAAAAILKGKF